MSGSQGTVPYSEPTSDGLATNEGRFSWVARGVTSSVEIQHQWKFSDLPGGASDFWQLSDIQAEALLKMLLAWDRAETGNKLAMRYFKENEA